VFGQANMTATFEKDSPDYVVIIARSATEFGVGSFGYDPRNGAGLKQWINGHYDRVYPAPYPTEGSPAGNQPFFNLQILKRRPPI